MLPLELVLGGVLLVSLTLYALSGGADYGAGVWMLLARGARAGGLRARIDAAIGPIWEANHVWLILVITVLFTGFPPAFARIATELHIPLTVLLVGIVLRGSAFAFRTNDVRWDPSHVLWRRVFETSSLITPVLLGIVIGVLAAGSLAPRAETFADRFLWPWIAPFPLTVGLLALAMFTHLAGVYLSVECADDATLQERFRRGALWSLVSVALVGGLVFTLAGGSAPHIRQDLAQTRWGRSILWIAVAAACGSALALWVRRYALARLLSIGLVAALIWGWALSQYPYLIVEGYTLFNAAAPPETLRLLATALGAGAVVLFPSLYYLFRLFKGGTRGLNSELRPTAGREEERPGNQDGG